MLPVSEWMERAQPARGVRLFEIMGVGAPAARCLPGSAHFVGVTLALMLALSTLPSDAGAACTPSELDVVTGDTVICEGEPPTGFIAPDGVNNLTVEIKFGHTAGDMGGAEAAVSVNAGSTVTNDGTIVVDGAAGVGLLGTNDGDLDGTQTFLTNNGTIEVNGAGGTGMKGPWSRSSASSTRSRSFGWRYLLRARWRSCGSFWTPAARGRLN